MLTQARLKELLHYDPETGVWTWRVRRAGSANAGTQAGSRKPNGYLRIHIGRRFYYASRLAFLFMTGAWPAEFVDHIDGNPMNDRWRNLRPATRQQNAINSRKPFTNVSGLKGVYQYKKTGSWIAQLRFNGRLVHLGYHPTREAAHEVVKAARLRLHGEFTRHQ